MFGFYSYFVICRFGGLIWRYCTTIWTWLFCCCAFWWLICLVVVFDCSLLEGHMGMLVLMIVRFAGLVVCGYCWVYWFCWCGNVGVFVLVVGS